MGTEVLGSNLASKKSYSKLLLFRLLPLHLRLAYYYLLEVILAVHYVCDHGKPWLQSFSAESNSTIQAVK